MKKNKNTYFFRNFSFWSPPAWGRSQPKNLKFSKNRPFFQKKWPIFHKNLKKSIFRVTNDFLFKSGLRFRYWNCWSNQNSQDFWFFQRKTRFFVRFPQNLQKYQIALKHPEKTHNRQKTLKFIFLNLSYQYIQFFLRIILFFSKNHSFSIFYNSKKVTESVHLSSLWIGV